jgi:MoxR-like ATPase
MMHIKLGYAEPEYERLAVSQPSSFDLLGKLTHVVTKAEIVGMQEDADKVFAEESIMDYLMTIITETRRHEKIRLGASTRGAQFFLKAAKAHAYNEGRDYVVPDDIRTLAPLVLGHRLILKTKFISRCRDDHNELWIQSVPL